MAKEDVIEVIGTVDEALPNTMFKVKLDSAAVGEVHRMAVEYPSLCDWVPSDSRGRVSDCPSLPDEPVE